MRIGFVDDSTTDHYIFQDLVQELGDPSIEVDYYESALELLEAIESMNKFYDILFLDINMPEMDGFDFLQELEEEYEEHSENAFIYLLTASSFRRDRERSDRFEEIIGYIEKPINIDILNKCIAERKANA